MLTPSAGGESASKSTTLATITSLKLPVPSALNHLAQNPHIVESGD